MVVRVPPIATTRLLARSLCGLLRAVQGELSPGGALDTVRWLADELQKQQVYDFAKQAGVKEGDVEYATVANEQFNAKLAAAIEAGNPPDVTRLYESNIQFYAAGGHLMDVNDLVEKMRREPKGIFESAMTSVVYKGRAMGVPLAVNPWPVHARIDLLEQAKKALSAGNTALKAPSSTLSASPRPCPSRAAA